MPFPYNLVPETASVERRGAQERGISTTPHAAYGNQEIWIRVVNASGPAGHEIVPVAVVVVILEDGDSAEFVADAYACDGGVVATPGGYGAETLEPEICVEEARVLGNEEGGAGPPAVAVAAMYQYHGVLGDERYDILTSNYNTMTLC